MVDPHMSFLEREIFMQFQNTNLKDDADMGK